MKILNIKKYNSKQVIKMFVLGTFYRNRKGLIKKLQVFFLLTFILFQVMNMLFYV